VVRALNFFFGLLESDLLDLHLLAAFLAFGIRLELEGNCHVRCTYCMLDE
jgi:hypothetical protein